MDWLERRIIRSAASLLLTCLLLTVQQTGFAMPSQQGALYFSYVRSNVKPVSNSANAWADFDNDGDLDLLSSGFVYITHREAITSLYRNDNGTMVELDAPRIRGVFDGSLDWADANGDGYRDIIVSGYSKTAGNNAAPVSIYLNDGGSGTFTPADVTLPVLHNGSVRWGDYDNDGDPDILLTGQGTTGPSAVSNIYRNNGDATFSDSRIDVPALNFSAAEWGDYDGDGDLDFIISGLEEATPKLFLFRNNSGVFVPDSAATAITPVYSPAIAWGDYDADGDLDLLVAGCSRYFFERCASAVSTIYRNDGGRFSAITAGLAGLYYGAAHWGDFDNDGDLDILINGRTTEHQLISTVYRNDNGSWNNLSDNFPGVEYGQTSWADFKNEGKLGVLVTGQGSDGAEVARLYSNNSSVINAPPAAPPDLEAEPLAAADEILLRWRAPNDDHTAAAALSYRLSISRQASANAATRPATSPTGQTTVQGTSYTFHGEPGATYLWSVQAVDGGLAGSEFAPEQSFTLPDAVPTATPGAAGFADVPAGAYYYEPVQWLATHGAISGYNTAPPCDAGQTPCFKPFNNTTRGQMVKIIVLAQGFPLRNPEQPTFNDVLPGSAFYEYVETAAARNIVSGYEGGVFRPNNNVTRGQLAKIVVTALDWDLAAPSAPTFADVPSSSTFYQFVETAVAHGVISGYDCGAGCREFRPGASAVRAQIAKIIYLARGN